MKIFSIKVVVLTLVAIFIPAICVYSSTSFDLNKLTIALKNNNVDHVVTLLNDAKEFSNQEEIVQYINNLWVDKNAPPEVSNKLLHKSIIRINIADFLMQAYNNGNSTVHIQEIHKYAKLQLTSHKEEVVSMALFVLAQFNDENDLKLIEPFIFSKSDYLFRSAALSLAMMCNDKVDNRMEYLQKQLDSSRKHYLIETRKKFKKMKDNDGYCR